MKSNPKSSKLSRCGVAVLMAALALSGCGKINADGLDREMAALKDNVDKKEAAYTPLAGHYEGTLSKEGSKKVRNVSLDLVVSTLITQNPGRNDVSEVPTLGGNLNLLYPGVDGIEVLPIGQFTTAKYDLSSGHLRLTGGMNTQTSIGLVLTTFEGSVQGERIVGLVSNSTRGELGTLDVLRVR